VIFGLTSTDWRGTTEPVATVFLRRSSVCADSVLKTIGFAGVQNFPTVGLIDGVFRANLEETGMSYALEVEMIAKARAKDLLTTPYVFNEADARAMAMAGADIVVCHLGLTTGGAIGAQTALKLADCPALVDAWAAAALAVNPDVIVLAHGGELSLHDRQPHGLIVRIELPLRRPGLQSAA